MLNFFFLFEILTLLSLFTAVSLVVFKKKLGFVFLCIALTCALLTNIIDLRALFIVAIAFIVVLITKTLKTKAEIKAEIKTGRKNTVDGSLNTGIFSSLFWRMFLHISIVILAFLLSLHLIAGFNNLLVLENVKTAEMSMPYTMYFNFDKAMVIFIFVLLMPQMLKKTPVKRAPILVCLALLCLLLLPLLGIHYGLIKPELSVPSWILLFALNNLFITSAAEEVFFRGYLQTVLTRFGQYKAVFIAGILFGLAHFAGGSIFILLAAIAGISYGLIYLATGRLYLAILAHFSFNLYHLIFFTYPLYLKT